MLSSHQTHVTHDRSKRADRGSTQRDPGASSRQAWSEDPHTRQVEMVLASLWRRPEAGPRSTRGR
jgi:hypothetical protein